MQKIKNPWRALVGASVILLALSACGGGGPNAGGGPQPAPAETASVAGRVAEAETGEALVGVAVQIGPLKTTSDSKGKFSLADVPVSPNLVVQFSKPEYAANFATVDVVKGQTSVADRRLARVATRTALEANTGGTVALSASPAMVQLPPGALVNAATGAVASGTVSVEMTPIDPSITPLAMPGNFRAQGESMPIESMGALQVEIRDSSGARLNLAAGKAATIRIPVPVGATSPPQTMPLYYFNESSGLWVREGSAALAGAPPHQYYEGQVGHFSTWNADMPVASIVVHGCVVNQAGHPLDATVTSAGIDYIGVATVQNAMSDGKFSVPARRNSRVQVTAQANDALAEVEVATGSADLTLTTCLVLKQEPPVIYLQPGSIVIAPGALGVLEVRASSASQYQWYRNGQPLPVRTRYLMLSGDVNAPGDYHVVASNEFGSVTSQHAQVAVVVPSAVPTIVAQPHAASVLAGSPASFSVQAEGAGLSYQWLRDGVAISSANGATLALASVGPADLGARFTCRVSNSAGSVLSESALLTLNTQAVPAAIDQQPSNASMHVGQVATFAVVASGTSPFTYQWLLNGVAIPNATSATYQTAPAVLADSGAVYSVRVSNAGGTVTSNPASLTVSVGPDTSGLYLPFMNGQWSESNFDLGAVPANGGAAVSLLPAGQGAIIAHSFQATSSNGHFSNYQMRSFLFWQNQRLYRQDLFAASGLGAPVQVSNLASAGLCAGASAGGSEAIDFGADYSDASKSWQIFRKPGPRAQCLTPDAVFLAVRMDMAATEAPLAILRPVADIHGANGALSGWLLRKDQQIVRVNADFSNPVPDFILPAADLEFAYDSETIPTVLLFASGKKVYALHTDRPAPSTPVLVTDLGASESLGNAATIDAQNIVIALRTEKATRLVRYSITSMVSQELGTVPVNFIRLLVTPTRLVLSDSLGKLIALPRTGGQAQTVYTPAAPQTAEDVVSGGERIWQQIGDSVVSVNSDGSGGMTFPGSQLAGCVSDDTTFSTDLGCNAVVVLQGTSLRAYDSTTGALRLTYGTIPAPTAPLVGRVGLDSTSVWGQGAVVNQFNMDPNASATLTAISYYIKTDQAGITRLSLP